MLSGLLWLEHPGQWGPLVLPVEPLLVLLLLLLPVLTVPPYPV
jgi:hypothetical protein